MSTLKRAGQQPINWKLRTDLEISPAESAPGHGWIIKDPLRLLYFRVADPELRFLQVLNGQRSLAEAASALNQSYPELQLSESTMRQFLVTSIRAGLLVCTTPGYGARLAAMGMRQRTWSARKLGAILSYRWRGIDPTWFLDRCHVLLDGFYRPSVLILAFVAILWAGLLTGLRWEQVTNEIPAIVTLVAWQNLPYLAAAVVFIKVLHELGHALTCRHFGGECHELGVLFVVFIPLLYCDVSDSWTQADRWKRMAVAGAGILTELAIAAVAAVLWMCSHPGVFHTFFLNVMIVCSLNTLLVNGNPLLRYDGYYVLSDLLGIPNLASESRMEAGAVLKRLVFGSRHAFQSIRSPLASISLALLGVASAAYRVAVIATILLLFYRTLQPVGLHLLALLPASSAVLAGVVATTNQVRREVVETPHRMRAWIGLVVCVLVAGGAAALPWSRTVSAPCLLTPGTSVPVYVRVPGLIEPKVRAGEWVKEGQVIAILRNPDIDMQIAVVEGEIHEKETLIDRMHRMRITDPSSSGGLGVALQSLEAAKQRLESLNTMREDLEIRSPRDGQIVLPRNETTKTRDRHAAVTWTSWAIAPQSAAAWIEAQTLLCWVGTRDDLRFSAMIHQTDLELIPHDATATVRFQASPEEEAGCVLESIDETPLMEVDRELLVNRFIPTAPGSGSPMETTFRARLQPLSPEVAELYPLYSTGWARIRTRPQSLAQRLWRVICHTFSFEL
ncbi:MAG: hypothetical protein KDA96_02265 [Planctomycetaceae bacterium]|nr:hypothetical protein [Planctomycetaceae bacterium]